MTQFLISDRPKTEDNYTGTINKDNIYVSTEPLHDPECYHYRVACEGCEAKCGFSFLYPRKLSFAFVVKFAGVLSSQCKKLAEVAKKNQVGLKQAELFVEGDN